MSESIWRSLAEKALGGAPLEALSSRTLEGLRIEPLYARSTADMPPALRQKAGAWGVSQRVDHPQPDEANRLARLDLEGGANGLTVVFAGETARGFGLPLDAAALATALQGIELDYISLRLDAGASAPGAARLLAGLTTARRLTSAALSADLGLDPIGSLARTGLPAPEDLTARALREFIEATRAAGLAGRTFLADGRPYHDAGAGEAQELAAVLATALAYLRRLEQAGFGLAEAARQIAFLLAADAGTFLTLAKFRALRRLWARVEDVCGLPPQPLRLHGETSWRMMTRRAPWVNVMRATAAIFAAGTGGADVITALPFTSALGLPEDRARRLARNTQLVLLDESHLAKVEDPAAGSGGLEALTDQLCLRAWDLFQEIEREGGVGASLLAGSLQARIATVARRRAQSHAAIESAITGTSAFPDLDERPLALAAAEPWPGAARAPLALPDTRDAAPFEALRDRADATTDATGQRPAIYLATLGSPAGHGPRATYAANFFAAGGIATVAGDIADYTGTLPFVCICGPDALYEEMLGEAIVSGLRAAGARRVLLVGSPGVGDGGSQAGLDGFIYQGAPALRLLGESLDFLERPALT
ncbi:MAG: methylmalonyl-CoA mutase family protein [Beijerinckiaceae bacterium]